MPQRMRNKNEHALTGLTVLPMSVVEMYQMGCSLADEATVLGRTTACVMTPYPYNWVTMSELPLWIEFSLLYGNVTSSPELATPGKRKHFDSFITKEVKSGCQA